MPFGDLRALLGRLGRDFAPLSLSGVRLVDEIECVISVLLAIGVSHLLNIRNVDWAAFSSYMVIRGSYMESLRRGSLRLIGTGVGVSLAWLLLPELLRSTVLLSAALAVFGAVTLYMALLGQCGYGWLLAGLTFAMVLVDGMEHSDEALGVFALSRFAEVLVGTCVSILVSAVSALTIRRLFRVASQDPARAVQTAAPGFWHKKALQHALQGAIALALIPWMWTTFHIEALGQSSITIMTVMMVALADLVGTTDAASSRMRHRFLGCSLGGLMATAVLVLSHDSPLIMTLAVCIGVAVGRHIENGQLGISYVGTQFALAFLVVLVPDCYTGLDVSPGLERLLGTFFGMALLEPVRLLFR